MPDTDPDGRVPSQPAFPSISILIAARNDELRAVGIVERQRLRLKLRGGAAQRVGVVGVAVDRCRAALLRR